MRSPYIFLALLVALVGPFNCMKYDDSQKIHRGYAYIGKFCFRKKKDSDESSAKISGYIHYDLTNKDASSDDYILALYDDQADSFPSIHNNKGMSCQEKLSHARYNGTISFADGHNANGALSIREQSRPRWWWAFVVKCSDSESANGETIDYKTHFKQEGEGSWSNELGYNEFGTNTMYCVYLGFYFILMSLQMHAYYTYKVRGLVHQLIKLMTAVIAFQLIGITCHMIDWIVYTETGYRQVVGEICGNIFMILASSVFLLLLFLLAQGWTVSHFQLQHRRKLLAFVFIAVLYKLTFFIWRTVFYSQEDTKYFYNGLPMYMYGAGMATAGFVYLYLCWKSYSNEVIEHKKSLYLLLGGVFVIWFWLPLAQIFIGNRFDPWVRDIAVTCIELTWDTISFGALMFLLWPTWAGQWFNLKVMPLDAMMGEGFGGGGVAAGSVNSHSADSGDAGATLTGLENQRL